MSGERGIAYHQPVLLDAVLAAASGARRVVDATLGDGGHAEALLASGAELLAIDRDPDAIRLARARLGEQRIRYLEASYASPAALAAVTAFAPDFILLDLGVSSRQFDDAVRGFSFRPGVPLDMRMEQAGPTAAELLNRAPQETLRRWLADYGDERRAGRLAAEITRRRARAPFLVSDDLVNAVRAVLGSRSGPDDFARIFQALRIAVNDELAGLERTLPVYRAAVTPGGALAAISYHSGEDRLIKHAFHEWSRTCICSPAQPVCTCRGRALGNAVPRGGIRPAPDEQSANPRARSARLRVFRAASEA
ncbi:MAG TPA: 16S rRNA (cytosine(1402)-N(4))-methyltransferase RsmH [Gemmatimonadales bacterium]|nr:16S rRNA (cytosine(1402)-N(4))-methyltransferase RsmH [Gemmatimonadales bacterium]